MTFRIAALRDHCDSLPGWQRHGLALALFTAALAVRVGLFAPHAGLPYVTFYPAIIVGFLLLGTGPAILLALLSALAGYYAFTPPYLSWEPQRDSVLTTFLFLVSCALVGAMAHELLAARSGSRQVEQRFKSFLDDQSDLFCRYKADGTIIFVNDAYCRDFGVERSQVIGHKWQPVAWPGDMPHILGQLATLAPGNPVVTIENRVVTPGKGVVWRQFINRAFFDKHGNIIELQSVGRDIHERKLLSERLEDMATRLQDLYDNAPCGYHSLDGDGRYLSINQTELDWLGCTREEVVGKLGPADFTTEEGRAIFRRNFPLMAAKGHLENLELDLVARNGSTRRVSVNATVVCNAEGIFSCTRSVLHDITARARAEARVAAESARFKAYLRVAADGVCILDADGRLVETSDSFTAMVGYGREELIGARPSLWDERSDLEGIVSQVLAGTLRQFETVHRRKDGTTLDVEVHAELFDYEGGRYIFCSSRDISGRRRDERRMMHMATHDALTGLPNRTLFRDRLSRSLALALRRGSSGVLLMLDLDGFKLVNDRYGHEAGDKVLKVVASRLNARVRHSDSVARIGGDEFAIVLDDIDGEQGIREFATQLMHDVSRPLALDNGILVVVGASVGAAPFPAAGRSRRTLLAAADRAMYASKLSGRNSCTISAEDGGAGDSGAQFFDATGMPRTGLAAMDKAHDALGGLVGGVELAMNAGAGRAELNQKLGDLANFTASHFAEEERWMAQVDYPDSVAHVLAHHQLLEELALLRGGLSEGNDSSLLQTLKDWIVIHIGAFDGPLAQYLVDHPAHGEARQSAL